MENEFNCKFLPTLASRHSRNSSKTGLARSMTHRRFESSGQSSSFETFTKLITKCDNQVEGTKQLREQINLRDKRISLDFKILNKKVQPKYKCADENYIINAIKTFRNEKKAFIYNKGRFISGSNSRINFW